MRHLLLHAASNMRAHALRQVQLHDIALLAPRLDARRLGQTTGHVRSRGAATGGCTRLWSSALRYYPVAHRRRSRTSRAPARACCDMASATRRSPACPGRTCASTRSRESPGRARRSRRLRYAQPAGHARPRRASPNCSHQGGRAARAQQVPWYGISDTRNASCAGCSRGRRARRPCCRCVAPSSEAGSRHELAGHGEAYVEALTRPMTTACVAPRSWISRCDSAHHAQCFRLRLRTRSGCAGLRRTRMAASVPSTSTLRCAPTCATPARATLQRSESACRMQLPGVSRIRPRRRFRPWN